MASITNQNQIISLNHLGNTHLASYDRFNYSYTLTHLILVLKFINETTRTRSLSAIKQSESIGSCPLGCKNPSSHISPLVGGSASIGRVELDEFGQYKNKISRLGSNHSNLAAGQTNIKTQPSTDKSRPEIGEEDSNYSDKPTKLLEPSNQASSCCPFSID